MLSNNVVWGTILDAQGVFFLILPFCCTQREAKVEGEVSETVTPCFVSAGCTEGLVTVVHFCGRSVQQLVPPTHGCALNGVGAGKHATTGRHRSGSTMLTSFTSARPLFLITFHHPWLFLCFGDLVGSRIHAYTQQWVMKSHFELKIKKIFTKNKPVS